MELLLCSGGESRGMECEIPDPCLVVLNYRGGKLPEVKRISITTLLAVKCVGYISLSPKKLAPQGRE